MSSHVILAVAAVALYVAVVLIKRGHPGFTVAFEQNRYLMGHDHAADIHVTA